MSMSRRSRRWILILAMLTEEALGGGLGWVGGGGLLRFGVVVVVGWGNDGEHSLVLSFPYGTFLKMNPFGLPCGSCGMPVDILPDQLSVFALCPLTLSSLRRTHAGRNRCGYLSVSHDWSFHEHRMLTRGVI